MTGLRIEKLHRHHAVEAFDCGEDALNRFLVRFALPNQMANASQTYIGLADHDAIVGFYTLVVGEVRYEKAPERLTKGLARHPVPVVPVMLLARLGVGQAWQGKRTGAGLLRDAVLLTMQVANIAGGPRARGPCKERCCAFVLSAVRFPALSHRSAASVRTHQGFEEPLGP